jgi:hypothetical protein
MHRCIDCNKEYYTYIIKSIIITLVLIVINSYISINYVNQSYIKVCTFYLKKMNIFSFRNNIEIELEGGIICKQFIHYL